jgi:hypothetical protein
MTSTAPARPTDRLYQGQALKPGERLTSSDNRFNLVLKNDGNLVLSDPYSREIWASDTAGHPDVTEMILQPNGNLVLQESSQQYWESKTAGNDDAPSFVLQDDGNLVMFTEGNVYWQSNSAVPDTPKRPENIGVLRSGEGLGLGDSLVSANGQFRLTLQADDGNLVEYSQYPVWQANTGGALRWCLILLEDGDLVLYDAHRVQIWNSKTAGRGDVEVKLKDTGKLAIYPVGGTEAIWTATKG